MHAVQVPPWDVDCQTPDRGGKQWTLCSFERCAVELVCLLTAAILGQAVSRSMKYKRAGYLGVWELFSYALLAELQLATPSPHMEESLSLVAAG